MQRMSSRCRPAARGVPRTSGWPEWGRTARGMSKRAGLGLHQAGRRGFAAPACAVAMPRESFALVPNGLRPPRMGELDQLARCIACAHEVPVRTVFDDGPSTRRRGSRTRAVTCDRARSGRLPGTGLVTDMKTYHVAYERDEGGWWLAKVAELPGCHTQGRTVQQARERIRETIALFGG